MYFIYYITHIHYLARYLLIHYFIIINYYLTFSVIYNPKQYKNIHFNKVTNVSLIHL